MLDTHPVGIPGDDCLLDGCLPPCVSKGRWRPQKQLALCFTTSTLSPRLLCRGNPGQGAEGHRSSLRARGVWTLGGAGRQVRENRLCPLPSCERGSEALLRVPYPPGPPEAA